MDRRNTQVSHGASMVSSGKRVFALTQGRRERRRTERSLVNYFWSLYIPAPCGSPPIRSRTHPAQS